MVTLIAGLIAAAGAWVVNGLLMGRFGKWTVRVAAPIAEELWKTITAVILGVSIPWTHLVFGLVEAGIDYYHNRSAKGIMSGIISLNSHIFYGLVTFSIGRLLGLWIWGMLVAIGLHILWNWLVSAEIINKKSGVRSQESE